MEQSVMPAPVSQESVKIPRLPGTRMLLKEAWNDYTDHFWTYIGVSAIPVILAYILLVFVAQSQLGFFVLLIPFALVAFIASIWAHVALIYAVTHTSEGAGIKESLQKTWNKFVSYFWIAIITGIITMGGFMLFVIPGIIFMIWFGFAAIIFINEGDRGFRALMKSRECGRNYWWAVFGRLVLTGLIMLAISLLVGFLLGIVFGVLTKNAEFLAQILQNFLTILITPFVLLFDLKIYMHLKKFKGQIALDTPQIKKDKKVIAWLTILGYLVGIVVSVLTVIILVLAVSPQP